MSKLAYFFVTLVGAVPAGGALYLMIMNLLDRADRLGGVLLGVTITISVCMVLVALTPFMVLVFYKDTRPKPASRDADDDAAVAAVGSDDDEEADGFGDVIPDDYDADELAASVDNGDDLDEAYDDGEFDDDTGFDDDEEYDDFDDE